MNHLYTEFFEETLEEASAIAKKLFGKVSSTTKENDNNQVLTEADQKIGALIIDRIQTQFPKHNIIDEEKGVIKKDKNNPTWVIDPIDGTSNFASGVPQYVIMIGVLEEDKPIAGGIIAPEYNDVFTAEKNSGAYKNRKRIVVTKEENLLSSLVAYTIDSHREDPKKTRKECEKIAEIVLQIRNLRASGSVYDGTLVAEGKYGAYLNRTSKVWDNVAIHSIITEAGGIYTDFYGKNIDYSYTLDNPEKNFTSCTASPKLHKKLQKIIHSQ